MTASHQNAGERSAAPTLHAAPLEAVVPKGGHALRNPLQRIERHHDGEHERRPHQQHTAPPHGGDQRLAKGNEAERAEARPEVGDGDGAAARLRIPEHG